MSENERQEISSLSKKYRPISPWEYFILSFLFLIPGIGFILLLFFALFKGNVNRRNYARSYFCILIIILTISLIAFIFALLTNGIGQIKEIAMQYYDKIVTMIKEWIPKK